MVFISLRLINCLLLSIECFLISLKKALFENTEESLYDFQNNFSNPFSL